MEPPRYGHRQLARGRRTRESCAAASKNVARTPRPRPTISANSESCQRTQNKEANASQLNRLGQLNLTNGLMILYHQLHRALFLARQNRSTGSTRKLSNCLLTFCSGSSQRQEVVSSQSLMRQVNFMVKPNGRLVLVSYTHYCASTSSLSTRWSTWTLLYP